jgi:hypothetical protein
MLLDEADAEALYRAAQLAVCQRVISPLPVASHHRRASSNVCQWRVTVTGTYAARSNTLPPAPLQRPAAASCSLHIDRGARRSCSQ